MEAAPGILGRTGGDDALAALGVHRLALPVPFPQAGGPVNAYLIENADGSLSLFDTGLVMDSAIAALERGFAEAGRRVEEVSRILISHGHVDHYGLARRIQARSGAKAFLHRADWSKVLAGAAGPGAQEGERLRLLGVPAELIERVAGAHQLTEAYAEKLDALEPLEEGQRFVFARFEAEILHFPGHTPGLVGLHCKSSRLLLTDDHLLERVSPNPLLELRGAGAERHRALVAYLASARRLYAMELDWLAPGHGAPFTGHRAILDSLFNFYERRQAKMLAALERAPRTAYELIADIFGEAGILQLYLMLSEVVGNLEVLEDKGLVTLVPGLEPHRYQVVQPAAARSPSR